MKGNRYYILIAVVIAMLPVLVSCRQELCYDHYPVMDISFTWEKEWERDYGQNHAANWDADQYGFEYDRLRPGLPEWVNTINYYDDGHKSEGFMSPDGQRYQVDEGIGGSMLLYNGDTEYIVLSDVASLNDARASATSRSRSRSSLELMYQLYENARTTNSPDILYAAFIDQVPALKNHEMKNLPVRMQPLVYTYLINYEFEHGMEHVVLARGALGGMAESVYLRTGATTEQTSIILFDCEMTTKGFQSRVRSFGIPGFPDKYYGKPKSMLDDRKYSLNLEVRLRNGKTVEFNYDITDQIKNQPRGGVINISGIRIEDEQGSIASGFVVDVDDWEDYVERIDLPIGNQPGSKK